MEQRWSLDEIVAATGAIPAGAGTLPSHCTGIATDTRALEGGQLFVPLSGERFHGHDFVEQACKAGAGAALWSRPVIPPALSDAPLLRVEEPLEAYQMLGRFHLRRLGLPVVAVTGSTGKTTTKDLIAALLGSQLVVHKTEANFNNDVGVPKTLLELGPEHQAAVLELAMRGPEQIRRLARLLDARAGIITNIGVSHIELLGSREAIADAKGELLEELPRDSLAILPFRSDFLDRLRGKACCPVATFSSHPGDAADMVPHELQDLGLEGWRVRVGEVTFPFRLPGLHHVEDLMAALLAAQAVGVDVAAAVRGLDDFRPSGMRMEVARLADGSVVLDDSYNAAPDSMEGALQVLAGAGGRRLAVLGDMLELGPAELEGHRRVGRAAAASGIDVLLAVGERSRELAAAARQAGLRRVFWAPTREEAERLFFEEFRAGDCILFKASRGMGLDRLAEAVRQRVAGTGIDEEHDRQEP